LIQTRSRPGATFLNIGGYGDRMDRFYHHVLCGLAVVFGLTVSDLLKATNIHHPDIGLARAACHADLAAASGRSQLDWKTNPTRQVTYVSSAGPPPFDCATRRFHTPINLHGYTCGVVWTNTETGSTTNTRSCINANAVLNNSTEIHLGSLSCVTRQQEQFSWQNGNPNNVNICLGGCEYQVSVDMCGRNSDTELWQCTGTGTPTGPTCLTLGQNLQNPTPLPPSDPTQPPVDPTPPPGDPTPPPPGSGGGGTAPPDDGIDDGVQVVQGLGPHLTAIEQAVLGLGPRIGAVQSGLTAAINHGTNEARPNAGRIIVELEAIRNAIEHPSQGGLLPGDDGGALPTRDDIIERGTAEEMISRLDTDGFGMTRGCPAMSWRQTFDLGWATFHMAQVSTIICWAIGLFGWMIALAGFIQASYILSRIGVR